MKNIDYKTHLLLTVFVSSLLLGNLLGSKVISIFGIVTSVGVFSYPITFLITDVVEEVRGKKFSKIFVHSGFLALCLAAVFVFASTHFPPAAFYQGNEAYKNIFSNSLRIIIASVVAFLIAQYHDLWAFNFWKQKTGGKHLWLRNNLSTIVSQLIDSFVFMFIAFYHQSPEFTAYRIFLMILPYWALKIGFALLDTPFVYLGVRWLASGEGQEREPPVKTGGGRGELWESSPEEKRLLEG
ncbi:MAG: queuosine precursor transporter [Methanosarcinaceae archaeon]|nr:queuosine precursor transporter [Methanosarcinaceae archaeon]MDD4498361.1 queuosine precursor transporter [Methanosarcinaceae archaeon]